MTVLNRVLEEIHNTRHKAMHSGDFSDIEIVIYIGNNRWYELMADPDLRRWINTPTSEETGGDRIDGCKIYRVINDDHDIRIVKI